MTLDSLRSEAWDNEHSFNPLFHTYTDPEGQKGQIWPSLDSYNKAVKRLREFTVQNELNETVGQTVSLVESI